MDNILIGVNQLVDLQTTTISKLELLISQSHQDLFSLYTDLHNTLDLLVYFVIGLTAIFIFYILYKMLKIFI